MSGGTGESSDSTFSQEATGESSGPTSVQEATNSDTAEAAEAAEASEAAETVSEKPAASSTTALQNGTASSTEDSTPAEPALEPEKESKELELIVKCIDGARTTISAPTDILGIALKTLIAEKMNVPPERQRLIFRGVVIQDDEVIGKHIKESGQTIHMVQRPDVPVGNAAQSSSSSSSSSRAGRTRLGFAAATSSTGPSPSAPASVSATVTGPAMAGSPPGMQSGSAASAGANRAVAGVPPEVSELLSAMFSAVARGGGNVSTVMHAARVGRGTTAPGITTPVAQPTEIPAGTQAGASAQTSPAAPAGLDTELFNSSSPLSPHDTILNIRRLSWQSILLGLPIFLFCIGIIGWNMTNIQGNSDGTFPWYSWLLCYQIVSLILGLPTFFLAVMMTPPFRSLSAMLSNRPGTQQEEQQVPRVLVGQTFTAMLPTSQLVFQQGAGGHADLFSAVSANGQQAHYQDASQSGAGQPQAPGQENGQEVHDEGLPWHDLHCFNERLGPVLGRTAPVRSLPPANMPLGELHAFLGSLQTSTTQLCTGMGELQASVADCMGTPPQQQMYQLSAALEAAAITLQGLAGALQDTIEGENAQTESAGQQNQETGTTAVEDNAVTTGAQG